jgi:glycosyltransferase involved in cell wall biosynthesis
MGALVSVIIPTYNGAHYLSHAIESVLSQTMKDLQVIIADDGSTDDTALVAESYKNQVEYTKINHAGLPAVTRNAGLKLAHGEYIAFLDADDSWLPEKTEKQRSRQQYKCLACSEW